jgi:hypothetical protein
VGGSVAGVSREADLRRCGDDYCSLLVMLLLVS